MDSQDLSFVSKKCKFCSFERALIPDSDTIHHCRICNKCVHFMDHHCVYISNCVGRNTLKPFILFLNYATVACLLCLYVYVVNFYQTNTKRADNDGIRLFSGLIGLPITYETLTLQKPIALLEKLLFFFTAAMGGMTSYTNYITLRAIYRNKRNNDNTDEYKPTRTIK